MEGTNKSVAKRAGQQKGSCKMYNYAVHLHGKCLGKFHTYRAAVEFFCNTEDMVNQFDKGAVVFLVDLVTGELLADSKGYRA